MRRTRRSLLAAGLAGLGAAAGCLGGSSVRYPGTDSPTGESGGDPGTAADRPVRDRTESAEGTAAGVDVDAVAEAPELARETSRICAEMRWFGNEYADAVARYKRALRTAATTTDRAREAMSPSLTADGLARVEAAAADATRVANEQIGDHFGADELVADEVRYHLGVVRKFRGRDDHDRVAEELERLSQFYGGAAAEPFVRRTMSRDPVRNRLLRWLGGGTDARVVYELRHPASGFAAYAHPDERTPAVEPPVDRAERLRYDRLFGPLVRGRRVDRYYVVPRVLPDVDENTDGDDDFDIPRRLNERPGQPILIQRFPDAETAAGEVQTALDGPVAPEGQYSFGRDLWRRVFYRVDDDVVYAFLVRAGRFLVATAPSETAWEERVDWRGPVERSWVWTRGTGVDTPTD
jgi:hypothetical protein